MPRHKRALHIFRRDLRLHDNSALNAALSHSDEVVTCFIFNKQQIDPHPYRSANGLAFMLESLNELASEIRSRSGELLLLSGDPKEVISKLISEQKIDALFFNKDYTPFSRARDLEIFKLCKDLNIECQHYSDALLVEPEIFSKDDGKPYTVYTPFFKKASKLAVEAPRALNKGVFASPKATLANKADSASIWPNDCAKLRLSHGGRSKGVDILKSIDRFKGYEQERDIPALSATTFLAPHNKFGTLSIREVYHTIKERFGAEHTLIRELYWRDFFTHIAWHFPHVFGHAFYKHYDAIAWDNDAEMFEAWCSGRTGFPIVDAGMRELVATGFMHNRVRMIVSSFLVKDLLISWQWGERFFARHLTDYDPAVNNGNWQWAASTGCDAQPYFRIFNPWLQQKRFDPQCEYIRRWIPELSQLSAAEIHKLSEDGGSAAGRARGYPAPVVQHSIQRIRAEALFRGCR